MKQFKIKYKIAYVMILGIFFTFGYSNLYAQIIFDNSLDLNKAEDRETYENQIKYIKGEIQKILDNDDDSNEIKKDKIIKQFEDDIKAIKSLNEKFSDQASGKDLILTYDNAVNETGTFWDQAQTWFSGGDLGNSIDNVKSGPAGTIINEFSKMVNLIGTAVIVIVTIFLGVKYIYGSVDSKASVKEGLLNLLVACLFFFGWNSIWNLLFNGNQLVLVGDTLEITIAQIFKTLTVIANFLAVGGVIFIGIKYIFAGAKGKSELKLKSTTFLIGVIMAFCAIGLLNYISSVITAILKGS